MSDRVQVRRALLSVSDKEGLVAFASALAARGVELVSTGGTAARLAGAGLAVTEVSSLTGFPDLFDGRVKTLHPAVHGPILAEVSRPAHAAGLRRLGQAAIDLVVVGLYPFEETVRRGAGAAAGIEQIDIGGPAMIRAAAKNHTRVAVLVGKEQFAEFLAEFESGAGTTGAAYRRRLAAAAFARTAAYDAAIAAWFRAGDPAGAALPDRLLLSAPRGDPLRYGENPHQAAAVYRSGDQPGAVLARRWHGPPCSYNNLADADAAFALVAALAGPGGSGAESAGGGAVAAAIVKHGSPCGVALGDDAAASLAAAWAADPESAFGGVAAVNGRLDRPAAEWAAERFLEVVIAPGVDADALPALARRPRVRVLETGGLPDPRRAPASLRSLAGGFLLQEADRVRWADLDRRVVTRRAPEEREWRGLELAWQVAGFVRSNAIVLARGRATLGIGGGQTSRVEAVRAAIARAEAIGALGQEQPGAVLASDAFFPFADGVERAAAAGVGAVIQPGGARRDAEVVAAADAAGMAMVVTGSRHFRH